MDFVGIGDTPTSTSPLKNSRDDLSSSMKSDASDTTLTDQFDETGPIRRTFTISNDSKPKSHRYSTCTFTYVLYMKIINHMTHKIYMCCIIVHEVMSFIFVLLYFF